MRAINIKATTRSLKVNPNTVAALAGAMFFLLLFSIEDELHAGSLYPDVRILEANERTLILEYAPKAPSLLPFSKDGKEYTKVSALYCDDLHENGQPVLPYRTVWIGIPPEAAVTAYLRSHEFSDSSGYRVAIAADSAAVKSVAPENGITDIYPQNALFPPEGFEIGESAWLRHQKVMPVYFYPVQYNLASERLRISSKIVIRLDWTFSEAKPKGRLIVADPVFEKMYISKILNYEQGKTWRRAPTKKLAKVTSPQTGDWFKLEIENDGIYKLDYSLLTTMGFDSLTLAVDAINIHNGGGRELAQSIDEPEPSLREVPSYFYDANQDGLFGQADYLLFYAQGTSGWDFVEQTQKHSHYINRYTRHNVYWLSIGSGTRKSMLERSSHMKGDTAPVLSDKGMHRSFREEELLNSEKSGIEWMWDRLSGTVGHDYPLSVTNLVAEDSANLAVRVQGISEYHHDVSFLLNGQLVTNIDLTYTLAKTVEMRTKGVLRESDNKLRIYLRSQTGTKSEIYFDWYELEYSKYLRAIDGELSFWSPMQTAVLDYRLHGFAGPPLIFDVTKPFFVTKIDASYSDSVASFQDASYAAGLGHHYLAVAEDRITTIAAVKASPNPYGSLRSATNAADYLIIAHESLTGPDLDRLAAHRQDRRYWPHEGQPQVKIVTTENIYNEFSYGLFDPTAIRNFLRFAYENWSVAPSYVLLVGDACYDMKDNLNGSPATLVPTFEEDLRATDDWFVNLDGDRLPDMVISRLPVRDRDELAVAVQKIITYDTALQPGPWKNTLLMVADDEYSPSFVEDDYDFGRDTEAMASDSIAQRFDINKLYLHEYSKNPFGRMPKAREYLIQAINDGALYVNFLGHGNYEVLAHEDIFYSPDDVQSLNNGDKLPLFFAGTCAVGQFDYDRKKSMAEELLLRPNGGCFAVIAATRWNVNAITTGINKAFYRSLFSASADSTMSIGQALLDAKLQSRYPDHRELIALFGDPAQRLAVPPQSVDFTVLPDSISLAKKVQIQGSIKNKDQETNDYSGSVFVKFYENTIKRRGYGYEYDLYGKVLFADTLQVANGKIEDDFFLQANSTLGGDRGRVVCYAWESAGHSQNGLRDASGYLSGLHVLADTLDVNAKRDSIGPDVQISFNGRPAAQDDKEEIQVEPSFTINLILKDPDSGINLSNKSGYEMVLQLDDNPDSLWDVTSRFAAEDAGGKSGALSFQFKNLSLGPHRILFSVWDNSLNHSLTKWQVQVEPKDLAIIDPLNYPNPAPGYTSFTFTLTHDAKVNVKVYTVAGRLVKVLDTFAARGFNRFPEDGWDCTDQDGDAIANGVYLYKIIATRVFSEFQQSEPERIETVGRMVIMR